MEYLDVYIEFSPNHKVHFASHLPNRIALIYDNITFTFSTRIAEN